MFRKLQTGLVAIAFFTVQAPLPALAQGSQRYVLLNERDVSRMNDNKGRLNLRIDSTRSIPSDSGLDLMLFRIGEILPGSSFFGSGLAPGDEIFALNGYEFHDGNSYTAYVHSLSGGRPMLDYIEHGTNRIMRIPALVSQSPGYAATPDKTRSNSSDGTTATVVLGAIGVGIVCWLAGCFSGGGSSGASSGSSGNSSQHTPTFRNEPIRPEPYETPVKPDTSIGCAWGDNAYGTCH